MRRKLVTKPSDAMHQRDMAKNMAIHMEFLTDAKVIAEFFESILKLGDKYKWKTYTSPFDGVVDIKNVLQGSLSPDPLKIKIMETTSVTEAPDHLYGEPMMDPGDPKLDPRTLTANQWLKMKWREIHRNRRPVARHTETGTIQSFDWVGQTTPPLQKEYMQPMIFKEDFRHAHAAYLKGQEISRDKEIINNHVLRAAFKAAGKTRLSIVSVSLDIP